MKTKLLTLLVFLAAACGQATTSPQRRAPIGIGDAASSAIQGWDGLSHRGNTAFDVTASQ